MLARLSASSVPRPEWLPGAEMAKRSAAERLSHAATERVMRPHVATATAMVRESRGAVEWP